MIKILIQVPVYLKKFLEKTYGESYQLQHDDYLGILILNTLKKKSNTYYEFTKSKGEMSNYEVCISMSFFDKYGCSINENDMILLGRAIDNWFRQNLYQTAILNEKHFNIPFKETIVHYISSYGISEDELSYSTIRRDFNRKKESIAEKLD